MRLTLCIYQADSDTDKPAIVPMRSSDDKSLDKSFDQISVDDGRPIAAPRTSKPIKQASGDGPSSDTQNIENTPNTRQDGSDAKSTPRVNAVQVLPAIHAGFLLKYVINYTFKYA